MTEDNPSNPEPMESPFLPPEESAAPDHEAAPAEAEAGSPIAALQEEVAQWKDLAMRKQADLENYRKRMAKEKAEAIKYANESLLETLLPVLDNLHFGLEAARSASKPDAVLKGMEMILRQFEDLLANHHVSAVDAPVGGEFNPNLHEAVAQEHHAEIAEGRIARVIRKGYKLADRLVRPANVTVSKGPPTRDAN